MSTSAPINLTLLSRLWYLCVLRWAGKNCFLLLRQGCFSVQACMFAGDEIPVDMVKYTGKYVIITMLLFLLFLSKLTAR